jgi:DNA-binding response OmpR family regulator
MNHSVLVVEDDAHMRRGMLALLRARGHAATAAASVAEAQSQLDAALPTHLLLDLDLPDGVGTEVLRRIRAQALPIHVALLTGRSDQTRIEEAYHLGVDAVFIKPADWDKLLEWVARA